MLTVLICAKNEIQNIRDCIESARFADEILMIDDFSSDGTEVLAKQLGATVIQRSMDGDWSGQRNFGIAAAKGDWIFVLDADERISNELQQTIMYLVKQNEPKTYCVMRENCFHHNKATHGVLRSDSVARLFMKRNAHYEGRVHEKLVTPFVQERISAKYGVLYHYTYDNWDAYFGKFNRYTALMAQQQFENGKSVSFFRDIVLRPWVAFFKMYIVHRGFLDGRLGYILSVNHFFYTMTKYVRLYYLKKSKGKL